MKLFNDDFIKEFNLDKLNQNFFKNRYIFTANLGQLENEEVIFYAQNNAMWFTADGVWFELREYTDSKGQGSEFRSQGEVRVTPQNYQNPSPIHKYKRVILKQEFIGANQVQPVGRERLSWNSNFFYGNDSSKWCTNVPNYAEVWYENLYDGIDLRYYSTRNGLKYDFIVHPGAEIKDIKLKYNGAEELKIDKYGDLKIITPIGDLTDSNLICYQNYNDNQYQVDGKFKLFNNYEYKFELTSKYDPNEILVIDPGLNVTLKYSTLIGGIENDHPHNVITDRDGNAVITGDTYSNNFPSTTRVFDNTYNNDRDIFICKLNAHGSELIFSTFIGGNGSESAVCTLDDSGNLYLAGGTSSIDFPITIGAYDQGLNGTADGFLMKLNNTGSSLMYSTYIGGINVDACRGNIILDKNNNAIVLGYTYSYDFPTTKGANDTIYNGNGDVVIFKFDFNSSKLIFSTFLGGNNLEDQPSMAVDGQEYIYVSGYTQSLDFPTTPGAYDRTNNITDIFISKLNQNCSKIVYSTFIGGTLSADYNWDITVDNFGNAVITGHTYSYDFPTTPGAYDTSFNYGYDCFILKLNHNGTKLVFSTFIGGSTGCESGRGIAIDTNGNIYVTGWSWSSDFPTTSNAYDRTYNSGSTYGDAFLLQLNQNGSKLKYSTYFGGTGGEFPDDLTLDSFGNVYITGYTRSEDFPQTNRTYTTGYQSYDDFYIAKFSFYQYLNVTLISLLNNTIPTEQIYSRYGPYTFKVNISDTLSLSDPKKVRLNLDPGGTNIQLLWDHDTGKFTELYDPFDYITIDPSSSAYNDTWDNWYIDFNVTFNWTYPHENLNNIQVYASSKRLSPAWLNVSGVYRVENDVIFTSELSVTGVEDRTILEYDLVGGGEHLNWTGLIPVYEGTVDIYPPADELDIMVSDAFGVSWVDSPLSGEPFKIETITPCITNTTGFEYVINLTGIPATSDNSTTRFRIKIDSDPVIFYDPTPDNHTWQDTTIVHVGITVADISGGNVNGSSIRYCVSTDNGNTWGAWISAEGSGSMKSMTVHCFANLKDGYTNFIKWRAKDSVGNGPTESEPYRILVDTQPINFSNPIPTPDFESSTGLIKVGITISDDTSGVNASTIKYSVSINYGQTWSYWKTVDGFENGNTIDVILNLTLPNGTGNKIKWRAYDVAGNGPTYSDEYQIIVDIIEEPIVPKIQLMAPENNSIVKTTSVELGWNILTLGTKKARFDVYFGNDNPPVDIIQENITELSMTINDLEDGGTYFWTVVPKADGLVGTCISGVWSFSVELPTPELPKVKLKTPENDSTIQSLMPTLVWELEYKGTEKVDYAVYFGTTSDPGLKIDKIPATHFSIPEPLSVNTTYYWYVVPYAGELEGLHSEVWWFSIKLDDNDKQSYFDLDLILTPSNIQLKPGEKGSVKAVVSNLGELDDEVSIKLFIPVDKGVNVIVNGSKTVNISSGESHIFDLIITTDEDAKSDSVSITVIAESEAAKLYNLTVRKLGILTVSIVGPEGSDSDRSSSELNTWNILIIIIIIICVVIVLAFLVNRKKRREEKSELIEEPHEHEGEEIEQTQPPTEEKDSDIIQE